MTYKPGLMAAAALALLLGAAAQAQTIITSSPTTLKKVTDEKLLVTPFNVTVDKIKKMDVIAATGERIGDIANVLVEPGGKVTAFTVNTSGFLGLGVNEHVMPFSALVLKDDGFHTTMTKEQIAALPVYKD